jgi:hypothetical protein
VVLWDTILFPDLLRAFGNSEADNRHIDGKKKSLSDAVTKLVIW